MLFNNLNYIRTSNTYQRWVTRRTRTPWSIGVTRAIWHRLFGRLVQRMPFRRRALAQREPRVHHCHAKPRHESRIVIRLPFAPPAAVLRGESTRKHRQRRKSRDSRNRIDGSVVDATTAHSFLFFFFLSFFFTLPHTAAAAMFKRSVEFPSLFQIKSATAENN